MALQNLVFFLVHYELPVLTIHKPKLTWTSTLRILSYCERTFGSITKFRCSVADRTFASTSVSSSTSKPNTVCLGRKQGDLSSLYTRSSLLDMKKEDSKSRQGVRKSTFIEFLRSYPQFLHASVVVDLAPVVKYLQRLDIKPNDILRVLERYPEVLGLKLEGT
ncbi:hypothetical protein CRYUN_Cryun14cG0096000 [Craigia yunnanensis]